MRLIHGLIILMALCCFVSCSDRNKTTSSGTVHILETEGGYSLIRNGKPFHVLGASGSEKYLKDLALMGGNTIRFYDTLNMTSKLDSAQKYNLAAIIDLPIPRLDKNYNFYERQNNVDTLKASLREFIIKYKKHPAVLFWLLGNEIQYPERDMNKDFLAGFNGLIDMVHEADPDHPVSTTIASLDKRLVLKIKNNSPSLDFISINIFGNLQRLREDLDDLSFFWKGPFLISEWADEGPWTLDRTRWDAPIEPTSAKKAERYKERYFQYVDSVSTRCLGSLAFYWGTKQERTHTWFSLFSESGKKSAIVYALADTFKKDTLFTDTPPVLDSMLLDAKGPQRSILFTPGKLKSATVYFKDTPTDSVSVYWDLLPDQWNLKRWEIERKPEGMNYLFDHYTSNSITFFTPAEEGAYRLFVYLEDKNGNFATANIPFFVVLNPDEL